MNMHSKEGNNEERRMARHMHEHPFVSLRDVMNQVFEDSFWDPFDRTSSLQKFRQVAFPKIDISETEKELVVKANLPGVDPRDVDIEVEDDMLMLSGKIEREHKDEGEKGKYHVYEREYGEFHRQIMLPAHVNADAVSAKCKNGVFEITLPKTEPEKKKKIEVQTD